MDISLIIPTYNRYKILSKNLNLLMSFKTTLKVEYLVIDDGSSREELARLRLWVKQFKNIKLFCQKHKGPAAARNWGIREAQGDVLVFINDDTIVDRLFLKKHFDYHQNSDKLNMGLIGPFVESPSVVSTPLMKWLVNKSNLHFGYGNVNSNIVPWYYFWTCNISVKKDFLVKNKLYFDESFQVAAWEDVEFGYRAANAGLEIHIDRKLKAYHDHFFQLNDVMARFYVHGRGMYHLIGKLPEKYLPMLAKRKYRLLARLILMVSLYPYLIKLVLKLIDLGKHPNNWLLQYLIVGEKIKGWDFEKNRL